MISTPKEQENPQSDFHKLLDSLKKENEQAASFVGQIYDKVGYFKPVYSPLKEDEEHLKKPLPLGVIETFYEEVYKLREINLKLEIIRNQLQEIVG